MKKYKKILLRILSDKFLIKYRFKKVFEKDLNLKNPQTFNEKMQWLKIHDRKKIYTTMVDKYEAKSFVAEKIGNEYIIPTLGIYKKWKEIDFSKLPNQFVIKCTHDSGSVVICKDKKTFNIEEAKKKIEEHLKINYYYLGREWPYKNAKKRIIIEEYLQGDNSPKQFDFFCFNGKAKFCFAMYEEAHEQNDEGDIDFLNIDFKPFQKKFIEYIENEEKTKTKPKNFDKMIEIAEKLSSGTKFLRVDLYNVNGKIKFGELTFYPCSGFYKLEDDEIALEYGKLLDLGEKRNLFSKIINTIKKILFKTNKKEEVNEKI